LIFEHLKRTGEGKIGSGPNNNKPVEKHHSSAFQYRVIL